MDSSPKLWPKIKKDHEKNTHGNGNAKFKSTSLRTQRNTVDFDFFYLFIYFLPSADHRGGVCGEENDCGQKIRHSWNMGEPIPILA